MPSAKTRRRRRIKLLLILAVLVAIGAAIKWTPTKKNETPPVVVSGAAIPGLAAVDIHGKLASKGFSVMRGGSPGQMWRCKRTEKDANYEVDIAGRTYSEITGVTGSATSTGTGDMNRSAAEFLGDLATLPYQGANPAAAKTWVETNVSTDSSTVIGGVRFELRGKVPATKVLVIRAEPK
jgi:hypothetical protein